MTTSALHDATMLKFSVSELDGFDRTHEPVSFGLSLPRGLSDGMFGDGCVTVVDSAGARFPMSCNVLSRFENRSPRWVLLKGCLSAAANTRTVYRLAPKVSPVPPVKDSASWSADLTQWSFTLSVKMADGRSLSTEIPIPSPKAFSPRAEVLDDEFISGFAGVKLRQECRTQFYRAANALRIDITLHNPQRANHEGGYWDLGDPLSLSIESAQVTATRNDAKFDDARWKRCQEQEALCADVPGHIALFQQHSGGPNYCSANHRPANGSVPKASWGSRETVNEVKTYESESARFEPTVLLSSREQDVSATMTDFWQKFPSGIEASENGFCFGLHPANDRGPMELQGGEKMTRTIWMTFDPPSNSEREPLTCLDWVHRRLNLVQDAVQLEHSGAVEGIVKQESSYPAELDAMLSEMLEGPSSFRNKNETIDEYGWRNFGDIWADHEQTYSDDPSPVISHYNNQYDLLYGLLRQFLQSGDRRWWNLAQPLAEHVTDVDIYHTEEDRWAYNGGLFWHTSHYRDVSTATHRTFSRQMTGDKHRVSGGGPGTEHNYASGLLLYHHLTGCPRAAAAVTSLADWVIAMDDGELSPFAPISATSTGNASSTSESHYHGPGRGVGNSIQVLLDAWTLTGSGHYLDKCQELIRICIHPEQDLQSLGLDHAELRWSYSVALQAILRFIEVAGDVAEETCLYARASLEPYGYWMMANERHFMDRRSELEFPTETWPAQDLRKGTTMMWLAKHHSSVDLRNDLHQHGRAFFDRALQQLLDCPTRGYTRPSAILLQQLPVFNAVCNLSNDAPTSIERDTWPDQADWTFQKDDVRTRIKTPASWPKVALRLCGIHRWKLLLAETPAGSWYRKQFRRTNR